MRLLSLGVLLLVAIIADAKISETLASTSHRVESSHLEQACQAIKPEIGDCGCAVRFLQDHLGPWQGLLLLKVWAAGEGRLGDTSHAFAAIYREYNDFSVLQATSAFLNVSSEFKVQCNPPGSMFSDERQVMLMPDPLPGY
jgi:hypothetical protein